MYAETKPHPLDLCKSGRPKKVVKAELAKERAHLDELTKLVEEHTRRRTQSEARLSKWKERWRNDQRAAGLPTEPVEMDDYPHKIITLDEPLVLEHQIHHYMFK